jgi:hypothetical protein
MLWKPELLASDVSNKGSVSLTPLEPLKKFASNHADLSASEFFPRRILSRTGPSAYTGLTLISKRQRHPDDLVDLDLSSLSAAKRAAGGSARGGGGADSSSGGKSKSSSSVQLEGSTGEDFVELPSGPQEDDDASALPAKKPKKKANNPSKVGKAGPGKVEL